MNTEEGKPVERWTILRDALKEIVISTTSVNVCVIAEDALREVDKLEGSQSSSSALGTREVLRLPNRKEELAAEGYHSAPEAAALSEDRKPTREQLAEIIAKAGHAADFHSSPMLNSEQNDHQRSQNWHAWKNVVSGPIADAVLEALSAPPSGEQAAAADSQKRNPPKP